MADHQLIDGVVGRPILLGRSLRLGGLGGGLFCRRFGRAGLGLGLVELGGGGGLGIHGGGLCGDGLGDARLSLSQPRFRLGGGLGGLLDGPPVPRIRGGARFARRRCGRTHLGLAAAPSPTAGRRCGPRREGRTRPRGPFGAGARRGRFCRGRCCSRLRSLAGRFGRSLCRGDGGGFRTPGRRECGLRRRPLLLGGLARRDGRVGRGLGAGVGGLGGSQDRRVEGQPVEAGPGGATCPGRAHALGEVCVGAPRRGPGCGGLFRPEGRRGSPAGVSHQSGPVWGNKSAPYRTRHTAIQSTVMQR